MPHLVGIPAAPAKAILSLSIISSSNNSFYLIKLLQFSQRAGKELKEGLHLFFPSTKSAGKPGIKERLKVKSTVTATLDLNHLRGKNNKKQTQSLKVFLWLQWMVI